MHARDSGYSLLELMMTLAVAAMILTLGLPSFSALKARNAQRVEINALFHAVHLARKGSIMRKQVVSLCPTADGVTCNPGRDWSGGFLVFENSDRDEPPELDDGEILLYRHLASPTVKIAANRRGFTLRATFLRATNGTLVVCDRADRVSPRALVISYTGRPRVAERTPRGVPYSCAD
jgi:prepilin-type N-terminal cleavage/methylation domain-containing protein